MTSLDFGAMTLTSGLGRVARAPSIASVPPPPPPPPPPSGGFGGDDDLLLMSGDSGSPPPPPPPPIPSFKVALYAFVAASPVAALLAIDANGLPCFGPTHPAETDRYPSLTYKVVTRVAGYHLDGDAGFSNATVDFEARSRLPGDVDRIILAIGQLFAGQASFLMAGLPVMWCYVEDDNDDFSDADDAEDDGTFTDTITVSFQYRTR